MKIIYVKEIDEFYHIDGTIDLNVVDVAHANELSFF